MDFRRLQVLVELRRRGTVTAAAQALNYSTSAASQQLAQLEQEMRTALTQPDGRKVRLTVQGDILADHAEQLLQGWERAQADVAGAAGRVSGSIRIAAFQTACLVLIPRLIHDIADLHPDLALHVVHLERAGAISATLSREIDLAIIESYPGVTERRAPAGGLQDDLFSDPMMIAAPRMFGGSSGQVDSLTDLAGRPWVMDPAGTVNRLWADELCRRAGFEPVVVCETDDVIVQRTLVNAGIAAAFLPGLLDFDIEPGVTTLTVGRESHRTISTVIRPGHEYHPAIAAVRTQLATYGR